MSSPITPIYNAFRYLPQHILEGTLGRGIGNRVEGWMGMSPAPDAQGNIYQEPGSPGLPPQWEEANRRSAEQQLHSMKKPLPKGK